MSAYKNRLAPDFSDGVDRKLLKQVRDRFMKVNSDRFERTCEGLSFRHVDILHVLPLLYHVNHALLPGFVSQDTPCGVSLFEPDKTTLAIAKTFSQTFRFQKDRRKNASIFSIFMMGSTGTLAHSESSDVDVWLCIDPALDAGQLAAIEAKAKAIDAWANGLGLEMHTFVMNADEFRRGGIVPTMDSESSGSAQHYLLLDEFYRTAILLSGRYPLWWLVPPALEAEYVETCELLLGKRFIKEAEVIDFGSAANIPKGELVGAGLWQLYKSLDAPYKSVLKLLLAEVYAQELPDKPTLSQTFKAAVYDDELDVETLDPYVLIFRRLSDYLEARDEYKRLDLVRKSFYLKVAKKLSRPPSQRKPSWQRKALLNITTDWGWPDKQYRFLDERQGWKMDQVLAERQELVAELSYSYRFLSAYERANNISSSITADDLNMLGRKLYAVFQRKAGKIERINPGIAPNIWEENLAIHHASSQPVLNDSNSWLLYRDLGSAADASYHPVQKRSTHLLELLAWLYFNGVMNRATRLSYVPGDSGVKMHELQQILATLESRLPLPLPPVPQQCFQQAPYLKQLLLFVNVGLDPLAYLTEQGVHRLSDRTDSLGYSSQRHNLVKAIDQVVFNSWHELSVHRYERGETLMQNLQAYLQLCFDQREGPQCELSVYCFCPQRADAIAKRVKSLFIKCRQRFIENCHSGAVRYVLQLGTQFFVLERQLEQFRYQGFPDQDKLLSYLATQQSRFTPIEWDDYVLEDELLLREVCKHAEPTTIKVFYTQQNRGVHVFVVDEYGSVFQAALPCEDENELTAPLDAFLQIMLDRRQLRGGFPGDKADMHYRFYRVKKSANGFAFEAVDVAPLKDFIALQVSVSEQGMDWQYDLIADMKEFSFSEYGERQFEALQHYLNHQSSSKGRMVCVSEIIFPDDALAIQLDDAFRGTLRLMKCYFDVLAKVRAVSAVNGAAV